MTTGTISQRLRSYLDDGLFEQMLAISIVTVGSMLQIESLYYMAWLWPWLYLGLLLTSYKRQAIGPRGGVVEYPCGASRRTPLALLLIGLLVGALAALAIAVGAARQAAWYRPIGDTLTWVVDHAPAVCGTALALGCAKLGRDSMTDRLVWLAAVSFASGLVADWVIADAHLGILAVTLCVGIPMWGIGYVQYRRFLKTHPLLSQETKDQVAEY